MTKLYFFGCSTTAGNELYEEKFIENYSQMTFKDARKYTQTLNWDTIWSYQKENGFPALTAKKLGVEFENCGIPGLSNQEIASRAFTYFPEKEYKDTIVFLQFSTHNRFFVKFKKEGNVETLGSFVVMPQINDDRLSARKNNLMKEFFLEFVDDSLQALNDHIYFYYAADYLTRKGIKVYIIWSERNITDWSNWAKKDGENIEYKTDNDPQFVNKLAPHFIDRVNEYDILGGPIDNLLPFTNFRLPRYHYNAEVQEWIACRLAEKLNV